MAGTTTFSDSGTSVMHTLCRKRQSYDTPFGQECDRVFADALKFQDPVTTFLCLCLLLANKNFTESLSKLYTCTFHAWDCARWLP